MKFVNSSTDAGLCQNIEKDIWQGGRGVSVVSCHKSATGCFMILVADPHDIAREIKLYEIVRSK